MQQLTFTILLITLILGCKGKPTYNDPLPKHDHFTINSEVLDETRLINVWTPPAYRDSSLQCDVLYMPDGGIKEDFPHIANTLAKLIAEGKIPPTILVGIENTERGRDMTGSSTAEYDKQFCPMTDGAKNFRAFIDSELIPIINKSYRTGSKKGIIGESLAGLFIMETFFIAPQTFDYYIAMDPSLWWNDHYLVKNAEQFIKQMGNRKIKLWFAGSDAVDINQYTRQLKAILDRSASDHLRYQYTDEADEKHYTIYRATKEKALTWALNE